MSRTSAQFLPTSATLWQLLQSLWLGAHLAALFLFMPLLTRIGFAPLLLQEVNRQLYPALLVITLLAVSVQLLIVLRCSGLPALYRQLRGQLLLGVWLLALLILLIHGQTGIHASLVRGLHGALLGCGLLLLAQPLPRTP